MPPHSTGSEASGSGGPAPQPESWLPLEAEPGLVSVIVPTYNRAELVIETLDSVYDSDYRPIELIVVDDGSTDMTEDSVGRWAKDRTGCARFSISYTRQSNAGAPAARNRGLRSSCGEFLQFLDSDDKLHRSKISAQVAHLQQCPEADFAYGPVFAIENPSRMVYAQSRLTLRQAVLKQIVVPTFTTLGPLCRRTMIERVGPWDESLSCIQDWEYFSRACAMGCNPGYVANAKSYYRAEHASTGRVRWSGEPRRLDEFVMAQFRRLESTLEAASPAVRNDPKFRNAIAWELSSVTCRAVLCGWRGDAETRYRQAARIALDRFPRAAIASAIAVGRIFGAIAGARYLSQYRWVYFKACAGLQRIKQLAAKCDPSSVARNCEP